MSAPDMAFWEDGLEAEISSPGPLQPGGGDGPEPNLADFELLPSSGDVLTIAKPEICQMLSNLPEPRAKAREMDIAAALDDIPIEEFYMPTAPVDPGLPPRKERGSRGASSRRKERHEPDVHGITGRRGGSLSREADLFYDAADAPAEASAYLDDDELPLKMPALPFASRLLVDPNASAKLQGDPTPSFPSGRQAYSRSLSPSECARDLGRGMNNSSDLREVTMPEYFNGLNTKPAVIEAFKRPNNNDDYSYEGEITLKFTGKSGLVLRPSNGVVEEVKEGKAKDLGVETGWRVLQIDELPFTRELLQTRAAAGIPYNITFAKADDDDKDSWVEQLFADSPRTHECGGTCRLVSFDGLSRGSPPGATAVHGLTPGDEEMSGLAEFVNGADDEVLSYLLNQAGEDKAARRRLAPGMLLPGQRPGFPLQL